MSRIVIKALAASALITGLSLPVAASAAGNAQRGLEKSQVCQSCHGRNGDEALQDSYPILAGQHYDYLVHALKAYRSGDRQNAIMAGFATNLSDQDIEDLAAWFSSHDGLVDLSID